MVHPWITPEDLAQQNHPDADYVIEIVSWLLWRLSGEKYAGISTTTEWYGFDVTCVGTSAAIAAGVAPRAIYSNMPMVTRLALRNRPVRSIQSISHAGQLMPSGSYKVSNHVAVVRTDGSPWLLSPGLEITYTYGQMPPLMGKRAAVALADELILAINGSDDCRLPDRVTQLSRQGVSITMLDPQDFLKDGRTGVYQVDLFLSAANPARAGKRPRVYVPGMPRGEYRV